MSNLQAENIDIHTKPEPLSAIDINFPEYTVRTLSNGMKVFIIEDHEQPTIALRFVFAGGTTMDEISGIAEMTAGLMTKGTKKLSAFEMAETMDGIGASYSASAQADYLVYYTSGLKHHTDKIFEIAADVLMNPTFPQNEFEKLNTMMLNAVQLEKSNAGQLAQNMARKVIYGKDHPYALNKTEESVKAIKPEHIREFYEKYVIPNNATLAVVGDVTAAEIIPVLEKYFGAMKAGEKPEITIPEPQQKPNGVYFVHRPGSVQSSVVVTTPGVRYTHRDYLTYRIAGNLMGAGFAGRLFRTLRETYSLTYSPFGYLSSVKYANRFVAGGDVNKEKTDSALIVINEQIGLLAQETPTKEEVDRIKNLALGNHLMSFERTQSMAAMIQNADFMGQAIQDVEQLPNLINRISPNDLQRIGREYMSLDKSAIIVVGESSVRESLTQFGRIYDYDTDLNPISIKMDKVNLSVQDLLKNYHNAIGGKKNTEKINSMIAEGTVLINVQGQQIEGHQSIKKQAPMKSYQLVEFMGMRQELWSDGQNAWNSMGGGQITKLSDGELENAIFQSDIFNYARLIEHKFKCEILGKQNDNIILKAVSPMGEESTYYFNADTYLLEKIESMQKSPMGEVQVTQTLSDYVATDGIKMPTKVITATPFMTMTATLSYKYNVEIDEAEFNPNS